jgi:tetratricopeptide (TPR) repeat protein
MAKPKDEAWLRQKLDELKADTEPGWLESSAICAAFGKAYGELGLFEEAVRFYDKGRTLQPADATIESLEQLANLKVRWALKRVLVENKKDTKDKGTEQEYSILELFNDAETILDSLIKIYPTQERYALKGKIYKGKAILQKSVQALQDMQKWYGKGYDLGKKAKRNDLYYPLVNRLAAEVVLSWEPPKTGGVKTKRGKAKGSDSLTEGLLELEGYADVLRQKGQSFWDWSLKSDCLVLKALYAQNLTAEDREGILKGYQEAKRREGSAKDIDSVVENIRFLEAMLGAKNLSKGLSPLAESLKALRESLEVQSKVKD